jgi:hypothetical protein
MNIPPKKEEGFYASLRVGGKLCRYKIFEEEL